MNAQPRRITPEEAAAHYTRAAVEAEQRERLSKELQETRPSPSELTEVDAVACRRLWATVLSLLISDATSYSSGTSSVLERLHGTAKARRELLDFAAHPNRHSGLGSILDLIGVDREAAARGIKRLADAHWPITTASSAAARSGVDPAPLRHYVSKCGQFFHAPPPKSAATTLTAYLRAHKPDLSARY